MLTPLIFGKNNYAKLIQLTLLCIALSACDLRFGPSDNSDSGSGGGTSGGGDNGGARIGVLTDASALEINFDSDFNLSNNAAVTVDGQDVDSRDLEDGMIAQVTLEETIESDVSEGTVTELRINHLIVGPVTQESPLHVLNQEVTVLAETELDGNADNLAVGDLVRVSGYSNRQGGIIATRLDTTDPGFWKLTGTTSEYVENDSFEVQGQGVSLNGVVPENCGSFGNNDYVEVFATPIPDFETGDGINSVTAIDCITVALPVLINDDEDIEELPAEMEGTILDFSGVGFELDDQEVVFADSVSYENGRRADIVEGAVVEVQGTYDLNSQELTASQIIFQQRRFFVEAPFDSNDITAGSSINVFGVEVTANNLLFSDELDVIASGAVNDQLRIHGFVDEDQTPYIISIESIGNQDPEDITLLGPVSRVGSSSFDILGISVDGQAAETLTGSIEEEDVVLVEEAETDGNASITTDSENNDGTAVLISDYTEREDRD